MPKRKKEGQAEEAARLPQDDTERLDQVIEYLDDLAGVLGLIHEAITGTARKRAVFVKKFGIEPEAALSNAATDVTRQTIQVRAQRVLAAELAQGQPEGGEATIH